MAKLFGQMQAASIGAAHDELVKNALADYAAENFEVASHTALVNAAQELNDQQTAQACQQILQEDQEMAQRSHQNLPSLVQQTLHQMTNNLGGRASQGIPSPTDQKARPSFQDAFTPS